MAVLVLDEGLVRGQGGFVKPRWGLDRVRLGNPGCAAIAATLGCGMQRRWRKDRFMRTRPVGRCHSIPCDGAFDGAWRCGWQWTHIARRMAHTPTALDSKAQGSRQRRVPWVSRDNPTRLPQRGCTIARRSWPYWFWINVWSAGSADL